MIATYEKIYPFAWLGILAEAPPTSEELVYSLHDRGFALQHAHLKITRLYLQCQPDEDIDDWSDERILDELLLRSSCRDEASRDTWSSCEGRHHSAASRRCGVCG